MLAKISELGVRQLTARGIVAPEAQEIYRFGLESWLLKGLHYLSMALCGLLLGLLPQTLIFLGAYGSLRVYAGGYHADSRRVCYLFSWLTILGVLMGFKHCPGTLMAPMALGLILISAPLIYFRAPVDNPQKPLDALECRHYQRRARQALGVILATALLCLALKASGLGLIFAEALAVTALMMAAGILKNNRGNKKRTSLSNQDVRTL
ncbi:MAG: accessory gene regulator B family protein [Eubacterium sp.]|nr:accessory gene regulator B family protein [Eubacterium sp.]